MTPLVLALQLISAGAALSPEVDLAAAHAEAPLREEPSDEVATEVVTPAKHGGDVRPLSVVAASTGIVLTDAASLSLMIIGIGTHGGVLVGAGLAGYVFGAPLAGLGGARLAGERGDRVLLAYTLTSVTRIAGMAAAIATKNGAAAGAILIGTEALVAPYVLVKTLASAPPPAQTAPAAEFAVPVRDPVLAYIRR